MLPCHCGKQLFMLGTLLQMRGGSVPQPVTSWSMEVTRSSKEKVSRSSAAEDSGMYVLVGIDGRKKKLFRGDLQYLIAKPVLVFFKGCNHTYYLKATIISGYLI